MKKEFKQEIILGIGLIIVLFILYKPFSMYMSGSIEMVLAGLLLILYAAFTLFFWRENSKDERESLMKLYSDRIAFRIGGAVLVIGIIIQSINHNIDNWLIATLAAMIVGKILGQIFSKNNF